MKKQISILFFIASIFFLTGCPYYSDFGLGNPQKAFIDTSLTGKWIILNEENRDTAVLTILKFNDNELYIEFRFIEKNKPVIERYRGYLTEIENQYIINLKRLDIDKRFMFIKYRIEEQALEISYASDEFITKEFSSQKEQFNFFKNNINKQELFEGRMKFIKGM